MIYSIVIPIYAVRAIHLSDLLTDLVSELVDSFEIILVLDNPDDEEFNKLNKLIRNLNFRNITVLRLSKNIGQHKALCCGFTVATGDYIVCMDDDYKFSKMSTMNFIKQAKAEFPFDLLYATVDVPTFFFKIKKGVFKFLKFLSRMPHPVPTNYATSLRIYSYKVAQKLTSLRLEFVYLDALQLYFVESIKYVPVTPNLDRKGAQKSNYSILQKVVFMVNTALVYTYLPESIIILSVLLFIIWYNFSIGNLLLSLLGLCLIMLSYIWIVNLRKPIGGSYTDYILARYDY